MRIILKTANVTSADAVPMFTAIQPIRLRRRNLSGLVWLAAGLLGILALMLTRV